MDRYHLFASLITILLLASCGRSTASPATATAIPRMAAPAATAPPPPIVSDRNLLTLDGVQIDCDGAADAEVDCAVEEGPHRIGVSIHAGTYVRWRLQLPPGADPVPPQSVLRLDFGREGDLDPHLYLVEEGGRRVRVNLTQFGLSAQDQTIHVPLQAVRGENGEPLAVDALEALEIVFEWADMAGSLVLQDVQLLRVWREEIVLPALPDGLALPDGFVIEAIAGGLRQPTQIEVLREDALLVSQQNGEIWRYLDLDADGRFEERQLYAAGFPEVVGLLYDPVDGAVWIGGRGQLWRTLDESGDGVADRRELRIDGLPWGRHQNNGLTWNPVVDGFSGEPAHTWIYFGLGSTEDMEVGGALNATVLRFPRDGASAADLEVVSRGNRNAYDVLWVPVPVAEGQRQWTLFASENGPDFNEAPDEVNQIRWGHHYGFPEQFGETQGAEETEYTGPLYAVTPHASANGLAYVENPAWPTPYRTLYVSLFGEVFGSERVGHVIQRVRLSPLSALDGADGGDAGDDISLQGKPDLFLSGLDRPLPLATDVVGNLLIGDYATGIVYRVVYATETAVPTSD